jgi:6-phosphogluconate dehydrogenase
MVYDMKLAVIGLGKMGLAIAQRVHKEKGTVYGYDRDIEVRVHAQQEGIQVFDTIEQLAPHADVYMIMVPAGKPVDDVLNQLLLYAAQEAIFIDGGNSHYKDSIRRAEYAAAQGFSFLDCGTSGGIHGITFGFCLMVGGDKVVYDHVIPVLRSIAAPEGYSWVGPSGTGHYVKMVHNGIEYGLLQAYAEGFELLKEGHFKDAPLDLQEISRLWQTSSVIRSFILSLAHEVFVHDQALDAISGAIGENGTGQWTVEEAHQQKISVPVIEAALKVRAWSRQTGGNYATKVIAMLRHQFGGHAVISSKKIEIKD